MLSAPLVTLLNLTAFEAAERFSILVGSAAALVTASDKTLAVGIKL